MEGKEIIKHKEKFNKFCDAIDFISAILLVILSILVLIEVFGRYLFNHPFSFTNEISMILFPWIIFLSMISITYHDEHMSLIFFVNKLPERIKRIAFFIDDTLSILFIFFIFLGGIKISIAVSDQMIGTLYLSKTFYYLSIDVSFAILLYMKFSEVILFILKRKEDSKI